MGQRKLLEIYLNEFPCPILDDSSPKREANPGRREKSSHDLFTRSSAIRQKLVHKNVKLPYRSQSSFLMMSIQVIQVSIIIIYMYIGS
jgi:hypothetical protein